VAGISQSNNEHLKMVELLRARDGAGLAKLVEGHLTNWREYLPKS